MAINKIHFNQCRCRTLKGYSGSDKIEFTDFSPFSSHQVQHDIQNAGRPREDRLARELQPQGTIQQWAPRSLFGLLNTLGWVREQLATVNQQPRERLLLTAQVLGKDSLAKQLFRDNCPTPVQHGSGKARALTPSPSGRGGDRNVPGVCKFQEWGFSWLWEWTLHMLNKQMRSNPTSSTVFYISLAFCSF